MTYEQIEIQVCRETDAIDAQYMGGEMSEIDYLEEIKRLNKWADEQFSKASA